ncbi:hypothetical protein [Caldalkalibacillus salinus]|uniref:hypothetical protein n=1 Tax=Caldalkalibacillus salinus TaxID=2803787 RepID=UPI001923F0E4|nr:hypothetical protein [Caldalkalibacillus salinus]
MSILSFFLAFLFFSFIGEVFNIDWLMTFYYREVKPDGIIFEARSPWIPIILATVISYFSWKLGKGIKKT